MILGSFQPHHYYMHEYEVKVLKPVQMKISSEVLATSNVEKKQDEFD